MRADDLYLIGLVQKINSWGTDSGRTRTKKRCSVPPQLNWKKKTCTLNHGAIAFQRLKNEEKNDWNTYQHSSSRIRKLRISFEICWVLFEGFVRFVVKNSFFVFFKSLIFGIGRFLDLRYPLRLKIEITRKGFR